MMRFVLLWIFVLAIFCDVECPAAVTPPGPGTPPLATIIEKTIAQADRQQKALQTMQYDQVANVEQLDDSNKTTKHEVLQMLVRPGGHPSMLVLSTKGDNLPGNQTQAQAQGNDVEGNKQNFTLHSLVNRFTITLAGVDQIDGEPVYVIAFTPKPDQPVHNETEKVVNQLQGQMWISERTFNVLQTEATLVHPVSVAWFLAQIPTLDFHYSLPTDPENGFAPCQVKITLEVKAFFVGYHVRQTIDMANFRPRPEGKPPG